MGLVTVEAATATLGPAGLSAAQLEGLAEAIEAASAAIERYCGRRFAAAEYVEVLRPDRDGVTLLSHFPVRSVRRLAYGRAPALRITHDGLGTTTYRASACWDYDEGADPADGSARPTGILLRSWSLDGVESLGSAAFGSAPTVASLAAAVIAAGGGWSASVVSSAFPWGPYPAAELLGLEVEREVLVTWADAAPVSYPITLDGFAYPMMAGQFDLDRSAGILRSWVPAGLGNTGDLVDWADASIADGTTPGGDLLAIYSAGFDPIPGDIRAICTEMAKAVLQGHATDSALKSESGLNYSYQFRDLAESAVGALPAAALRALATYRTHRA